MEYHITISLEYVKPKFKDRTAEIVSEKEELELISILEPEELLTKIARFIEEDLT